MTATLNHSPNLAGGIFLGGMVRGQAERFVSMLPKNILTPSQVGAAEADFMGRGFLFWPPAKDAKRLGGGNFTSVRPPSRQINGLTAWIVGSLPVDVRVIGLPTFTSFLEAVGFPVLLEKFVMGIVCGIFFLSAISPDERNLHGRIINA